MKFGTWRWWRCQPHATVAFTSRKCSWLLIFTRGWVDPRAMVRSEGICHQKFRWLYSELMPHCTHRRKQ